MTRETKAIAALLAFIPTAILSAALTCTAAAAHGASPKWRLLFRLLCHGIERRCLVVWQVPMPICARCTAIYAGLLFSVGAFFVLRLRVAAAKRLLMAAALAMALDGLSQAAGLRESTNRLRIATGAAVGMAFGMWALASMENTAKTPTTRGFTAS